MIPAPTLAERVTRRVERARPEPQPDDIELLIETGDVEDLRALCQRLGTDQRVTPAEALRAITINAAAQYGEADEKGSLTPGKLADLVVLDGNPLTVDPMAIKDITVLETVKEGQSVYRA